MDRIRSEKIKNKSEVVSIVNQMLKSNDNEYCEESKNNSLY